jgi:hypothetical protein
MADAPERPNGGDFSELEQSFFASAPPDVPVPPAEPERFDDLFPAEPRPEAKPPAMGGRLQGAWVTTATVRASMARVAGNARGFLERVVGGVGRSARLALGWARRERVATSARAWRGAGRAVGAARAGILRTVRAVGAGIVGALPVQAADWRAIAGVASLALLMGISAAVVASRDGSRRRSPAAATALAPRAHPPAPSVATTPLAPTAVPPVAPADATPVVPDVRPRTATTLATGDLGPRAGESAKRPVRHRRVAAYSAQRDLIVPEFMTRPSPPPPPVRAAPAPVRKPFFSR